MRLPRFVFVVAVLLLGLPSGCRGLDQGDSPPAVPSPAPTPSPTMAVAASVVPEPTPESVTVVIWGPLELSPHSPSRGGDQLRQLIEEFETFYPDIQLVYEPKPATGAASLLNYLRSASAVAPAVLPDLLLLPTSDLTEVAETQLLFPLDGVVPAALQDELYPFALRDGRIGGNWIALPLVVQVEHGVTRPERRGQLPPTLEGLLAEGAPIWLFAGQAEAEGELSDAYLLQLIALTGEPPRPDTLPPRDEWIALLATLQAAQQRGTIPRQVLSLDESALYERLRAAQADLIQSNSRRFLAEQEAEAAITFAPLPTQTGAPASLVEGYLLALTTDDPRQQAAVALYLDWLLDPLRLGQWSRADHWLPTRRSALAEAVVDASYRTFVDEQLEAGWLRPSDSTWSAFAQVLQEQFRTVLSGQATPTNAVDSVIETYAP